MFNDRYAMAKFSKGSTLIFVDTRISLNHSVGLVERSLHAKKQINPLLLLIEHQLVTDMDTDTGP